MTSTSENDRGAEGEQEPEQEPEAMPTTAAYLLWDKSPELEGEPMKEPEQEPVEEIASIKPAAKGKLLRPFFGRLTAMFSSVLG